jgi:hypothetical protein
MRENRPYGSVGGWGLIAPRLPNPKTQQCRASVPNSSARRASGGLLRLFGFSPEDGTSLPVCIGQSRLLPQASNQGRSGKTKRPEL